jgi:hypothetical protein
MIFLSGHLVPPSLSFALHSLRRTIGELVGRTHSFYKGITYAFAFVGWANGRMGKWSEASIVDDDNERTPPATPPLAPPRVARIFRSEASRANFSPRFSDRVR